MNITKREKIERVRIIYPEDEHHKVLEYMDMHGFHQTAHGPKRKPGKNGELCLWTIAERPIDE